MFRYALGINGFISIRTVLASSLHLTSSKAIVILATSGDQVAL